eukprot:TRINITY_DN6874_c0_g1_i2.p3 TRINITY_DN6874_c0_g1~~TRINITY_DN6874_c0_g1_i2.p3  ORF type:complete len:105 (+),score=15.27 TRINITY_DN6874_c0_g1_i2:442-756(+)
MRRSVVAAMQDQRDFLEFFVTEPWDRYITRMSRSGVWGGEPELAAAPAAVQASIHVYAPKSGSIELLTVYGEDFQDKSAPVRVLFYGAHYDALIDESLHYLPEE